MKANELMIGDWVQDQGLNKPIKWHQLQFAEEFGNSTYMVLVKPIPLTGEMLKVNGFKFTESLNCWSYRVFDITNRDNFFICNVGSLGRKFKYAHQLQQALRLCGMNDLADNFRI